MPLFRRPPAWRVVLLSTLGMGLVGYSLPSSRIRWVLNSRVHDDVRFLERANRYRYEEYLQSLYEESGVDIHLLVVGGTGDETLERFSIRRSRELGVGRRTGRRGVLIAYDTARRAMRLEVGPNLQGIITDGFSGYLIREHNRAFFARGEAELGIRTTTFMILWRLRAARLGEEYDPSFQEYVHEAQRLASGGGASGQIDRRGPGLINRQGDSAARAHFTPQPSVEQAYRRYLEWAILGEGQTDVPLFTRASQFHLAGLPISRALNTSMLALEFRRRYEIDERGDLAMLYFTDTPFVTPRFFRRGALGWQMDIMAGIHNTQEVLGWYTWTLIDSGDDFSRTFADRYLPTPAPLVEEFYRVAGADNRQLPTRGLTASVESELAHRPMHRAIDQWPAGVEHLTVRQAAGRITAARGRPTVVVLYQTFYDQPRAEFPGLVRLAEFCRERGIALLAFNTDRGFPYDTTVASLTAFLAAQHAPFPPIHMYRWRAGLLDATMDSLGIQVGTAWMPPLAAVLDHEGRVVWQAQRVTDWAAVITAAATTSNARPGFPVHASARKEP